jgi:pyruvate/2-oxoglutarate dehydrogenase complex dihydrolipoamide dehydrogenase (E3) component
MNDTAFTVEPWDKHNQELVSNVRPADWTNPEPAGVYNLVVIGAGPAGLVAAAGAAGLGAKVALIEKHLIGGDCLNVGCVPSKCLISSSRTAAAIKDAAEFGMIAENAKVDFPAVMERMRKIRAGISANDAADRFKKLGVDVFIGEGKFTGPTTAEVDGKQLEFRKALIATGARPAVIPIDGLEEAGYLTNETIFSLTELPKRLLVLGAGPIGAELAQAFQRLGAQVTIAARSRLLSRYDPESAEIMSDQFSKDDIDVKLNAKVNKVTKTADGREVSITSDGKETVMVFDEILVAIGRAPNVEGLNLEAAGVEYDTRRGVTVDDTLRTANKKIFAAGDVSMKYKFTHSADAAARIVIQNALFKGSKKITSLIIPHCTYTHPEVAHVGHYNDATETNPDEFDVYKVEMNDIDRAIADGETSGFVKVFTQKGKDTIMGATVVSAHAGEMISELTVAMNRGLGLGKLAGAIHPYPTQAEAIKRAADAYSRTKLTPTVSKLMKKWMDWQRK